MTLTLKKATEEDRAFFRYAHHTAYRSVVEAMFGWDEIYQDAAADRDFDTRNPHLIQQNHISIGVIGWQVRQKDIWFGPIFVLPEYQGRGVGSNLVTQFMEMASAQAAPLRLQTLAGNLGAKKLYERLGFKVLASDAIHWQMEYLPSSVRATV